ncbi:centrosomal protein of 68 kDa-like isoform X1 [Acipenser ruthenus]|uniref:centrosomal protein of 68 kDa-like isoform X1 n=1 Tax=Acipenser ruthenus TaxID=7906 RepID=UPI00145A5587|nr:centrosomal protein of 68 kDa-like isoform X1 [Acipenser ruthenus]XP_033859911.1 centrosomal protein of 68 kDa-like isoform X1 [Acipenser ruthenus]
MALEVERIFSEMPSEMETKTWNYSDQEKDIPELVHGVHQLMTIDESKSPAHRSREALSAQEPKSYSVMSPGESLSCSQRKTVTIKPFSRYSLGKAKNAMRKPLYDISTDHKKHSETDLHVEDKSTTLPTPSCEYQSKSVKINDNTDCGSPHQGLYEPATSHAASYSREGNTSYHQTGLRFDSGTPWSSRCCFSSPPLGDYSTMVKMSPRGLSAPRPSSVEASNPYSRLSKKNTSQVWKSLNASTRSGRSLHHSLDEPLDSKDSREKCPYQADYWACAIPSALPPSPNRMSPHWDPNEEYRVLLDYTYPLRPNHSCSRGKSGGDPIVSDPLLHDSGIELDSFCYSTNNTLRSTPCLECDTAVLINDNSATESPFSGKGLRPSGPEYKEPCHLKLGFVHQQHVGSSRRSISPYSSDDYVDLSLENSNSSAWFESHNKKLEQRMWHHKYGVFSSAASKPCFIPTTQILPLHKAWDSDEEYLSLPLRLKELEVLSQQLNTIAVQISKPGDVCCETQSVLEKDTASPKTLYNQVELMTGEGITDAGALFGTQTIKEDYDLENDLQSAEGELTKSRLKKVSYFMEQLGGLSLFEFEKKTQVDHSGGETKESLMQHIQTFCYKLEELIQWLYQVAEKIDSWNPPAPDIDSVKASLDVYKKFQKEVDEHQPLTTAVLKTGEILLCCMSSTSPVLKETLGLVEKQSEALDKHAEHLYSSILTAMDIIRDEVLTMSDPSGDSTVDSIEVKSKVTISECTIQEDRIPL